MKKKGFQTRSECAIMLEDSSVASLEEFHLHRESYLPMVIIDRMAALERGGVGGSRV